VGRSKSVKALTDAMNAEKRVFLATQNREGQDNPQIHDIGQIGTIGKVLQLLRLPDGTVKALIEGKQRGIIRRFVQDIDFFMVEIEPLDPLPSPDKEGLALGRAIMSAFEEYTAINKSVPKDFVATIGGISNLSQL
jgi:ATP-dependent Lon protease